MTALGMKGKLELAVHTQGGHYAFYQIADMVGDEGSIYPLGSDQVASKLSRVSFTHAR